MCDEPQKLIYLHSTAKGQLTKANATKTKMENLARELQKVLQNSLGALNVDLTSPAG
jgi:hypothetical protein